MASGSQVYSGIWADLPVQPRNRNRVMRVTIVPPAVSVSGASSAIRAKSRVPSSRHRRNIATRTPKSPIRFMMNAFLPASALALSLNQKPMRR
jgi:hypothetical protein